MILSPPRRAEAARILDRMAELCGKVKKDFDEMKRAADEWRAKFPEMVEKE